MTAEKTIQTINAILTAYAEEAARMGEESSYINKALEEVKNDPAGWTMRNPDYKNASGSYKLFGACAAVLMDARSGLRNDTTSRDTVAALKRIINNTPDNIKSWKGICPVKDKYIICDGIRAVELLEDVPELPRAEFPEALPNLERIWTCAETKIPLVKPEKAEIKAYLAAEKAAGRGKASAPAHPYPITAEGGAVLYMVNPSYILDMIDALPGGVWYATGKTSPVYIEAENGRGILLPVNPEAEKRAEIAENWKRINSPAPAKKAEEPAPEAADDSRPEETPAEVPQNAPESTEAPEAEETTAETAESEIEPEEAAKTPAPAYTITKNAKYNSLEISFQSKPSAEVREALKALRFRWNGKAGIWYGYATEEATRAAIEGKEAPEAAEKPQKVKRPAAASVIDLSGLENNKKTAYGADFAAILRADLKARGVSGVTIRCNRSGYTDSITATVKVSADDFRSAEECAARDGWGIFFTRQENGWGPTVDGVEYSHFYAGKETENKKYITCGSAYNDSSAESNFHILRRFWLNEISRFDAINNHNMTRARYIELTDAAFTRISAIVNIINSYNWDNSDPMSDYYDVGFYLDIDIKKPEGFVPREYMTEEEREQMEKDFEADRKAEAERLEALKREEEESRKAEAIRAEQEKRDRAEIAAAVSVVDLPEENRFYILGLLGGIGKENSIAELKERADRPNDAYITRTITFCNTSALEKFENMLLYDFDFIGGKGGTGTNDPRVTNDNFNRLTMEQRESVKFYATDCIAVYMGEALQFVINPEGYNYSRYAYIPTAETVELSPEESAAKTAAEESASLPPFYFPTPVTDQAAGLPVGEVITIYQADGWTMQNHATTGKLLSATPGNYAQYSGVFLDIQTGEKAARIFCRDGKETVIFSGLPYRLPDAVKYESIKEGSTGARICQYRDQADEMRHIIQFYSDMGRSPILDTVQR